MHQGWRGYDSGTGRYLVNRTTASSGELSEKELKTGGRRLAAKVECLRPRAVVVLGVGVYRAAFGRRRIVVGLQPETLDITPVWVLPNPSGLNANCPLPSLVRLFRRMRRAVA